MIVITLSVVAFVALLFVLPAVLVWRDLRDGRRDPAFQESDD